MPDACMPVFTATRLTAAQSWVQPGCPSADEWMSKWRPLKGVLLSHEKERSSDMSCGMDDLEDIMLNEISQTEKDKGKPPESSNPERQEVGGGSEG